MIVIFHFETIPAYRFSSGNHSNMESHQIPQACLSYAYLLFGKSAFRETLCIRGKGKTPNRAAQKHDFV